VKTKEGIYGFSCVESNRVWFFQIVPMGQPATDRFLSAIDQKSVISFVSEFNSHRLIFGIRKGFEEYDNPDRTATQMLTNNTFWNQARG
jgi:hypothetical protein